MVWYLHGYRRAEALQQNLEQQIKDRTEELAESNVRLQNEMLEKDLARRKLDEETAKMMRSLKRRSGRSALLAKMGELLQSCQTREEVFTAALGFAPKIFPSRRGLCSTLPATSWRSPDSGMNANCRFNPLNPIHAGPCVLGIHILCAPATSQPVAVTLLESLVPFFVSRFSPREKHSAFCISRPWTKIPNWGRRSCLSKLRSRLKLDCP